jgi:tetratricopeptide (TPR) repeat protein
MSTDIGTTRDAASAPPPASGDAQDWAAWAREAVAEKRWAEVVARFDLCIARFGVRPHWTSQKANALRRLDRLDEAQALYEALARDNPQMSAGLDGLAWTAARRGDHAGALTLFTRCIETYHSDKSVRIWKRQRGLLLMRLGRADEAEAAFREMIETDPTDAEAQADYVRSSMETGRHAPDREARREVLVRRVLAQVAPQSVGDALQLLVLLGAISEAADLLLDLERRAQSAHDIETCFHFIPRLVERGSRGALWDRLLSRLRADGETDVELELGLLLALERFGEFVATFDERRAALADSRRLFALQRVRDRLAKPRHEVFSEEKVFGIGLSRTGTTSLAAALGRLGIDAAHWTNPLTHQLLSGVDYFMFGAATDCCVLAEMEKLYYQYPNARFVLTTRPLEPWLRSFADHHDRHSWAGDIESLRAVFDRADCAHKFEHAALEYGLYLNAETLTDAYQSFETRVRHFFSDKPANKLLTLDLFAGQGWPELCGFLGRPIPSAPFPKLNAMQAE